MKIGLRHVGIVVQNIEESIQFWEKHFNFSVYLDQIEEGSFIDHLLNLPNTKVRTVKLKAPDNSVIELLDFFANKNENVKNWEGDFKSIGLTHIALNVTNLSELVQSLNEAGFTAVNAPRISENGSVSVAFIEGPEGLLLELVELA
jgi:catechol 2,3-dioxygenase-like lactoylglutathione lyase family enzyme